MKTFDLKVGNLIMADLKGFHSKKGMVTEIYKDTVKVMDLEDRVEEILPVEKCYGITLTDDLLISLLRFESHTINQQFSGTKSAVIDELIKVLLHNEDEHLYWFLKFPKEKLDGNFVLIVENCQRIKTAEILVRYLHELQNIVYQQTGQIIC